MSDKTVPARVSRRFDAPPEQVFDAWFNADTAGAWLFATPQGEMVQVEIDPRVGGHFHIVERRGGEIAAHHGVYTEIDRPRRLAFRFSAQKDVEPTRVVVEIAPSDGGSAVVLTHELAPAWADFAERAAQGWSTILDALARSLGETPRPS